jgi:hypothetical protein
MRWLGVGFLVIPGVALALTPGLYFVQGSWVNVPADASANAAVTAHVVTNTQVEVVTTQGGTCEIRWGGGHGFVPCKLLGAQALTLAALEPDDTRWGWREDRNSPLRAFWAAPSAERLFSAGLYFQRTLLGEAQFNLEQGHGQDQSASTPPVPVKLLRYPVPEFEAMKAVLAKGVVAPALTPQLCPMPAVVPATATTEEFDLGRYCALREIPALKLPAAKTSLFTSPGQVAAPSAGVEALSARFGVMESGAVLGGPKWILDYDLWRYEGAWDIGHYRLTLAQPLVEVVVGRTGLVGDYRWTPSEDFYPNDAGPQGCDEDLRAKTRGRELLPDYPAIKDRLLWFETTVALPFRHAHVKKQVLKLDHEVIFPAGVFNDSVKAVVIDEIDLDGDGVPDLVEWNLVAGGEMVDPDKSGLYMRADFVNAGGRWYLLDAATDVECT